MRSSASPHSIPQGCPFGPDPSRPAMAAARDGLESRTHHDAPLAQRGVDLVSRARASARVLRSGADVASRHLALDLALRLDIAVDLLAELVRLRCVEVDLLLEDVRQPPTGHPDMVEVLHQDERVHRGQVGRVIHLLHARIVVGRSAGRTAGLRVVRALDGSRESLKGSDDPQ